MPAPLSVIILTLNEETTIGDAILSAKWADEVLVVDSHSTDTTRAIAEALGAKVLTHTFEDYSKQRNWAIAQATHDWVLMLDADERLSTRLQHEIAQLLQEKPLYAAYSIRRLNYFMGQLIRYSGWQNDWVVRLFLRTAGSYGTKTIHEEYKSAGKTGKLKHTISHHTYKSLASYMEKHDAYSTALAKEIVAKGKKITLYHLLLKPAFRFFRAYLLKLGVLDGKPGLVIAWLASYSVFMRHLKAWRLQQGDQLTNP